MNRFQEHLSKQKYRNGIFLAYSEITFLRGHYYNTTSSFGARRSQKGAFPEQAVGAG